MFDPFEMSKGGNYTSAVNLHSCSSGRVACETAAEEPLRWGRKDAGFMEVEKARMEKCFPGFEHGRFFHALSAKLVLSWGRSKVKDTTTTTTTIAAATSQKTMGRKKKQQQQSGSGISFHSVPEENVSHNMDPVSPLVSCIGQVRAGGQRRSSSNKRRNHHHRRVVSEESSSFQGRWKMCMPCTSSASSINNSSKDIRLILRSASSSVSSSGQSLLPGSGEGNGGCMLAKSLLLLQQQMDTQKISDSSSESSPHAAAQSSSCSSRNQPEGSFEIAMAKRVLRLEKPVRSGNSEAAYDLVMREAEMEAMEHRSMKRFPSFALPKAGPVARAVLLLYFGNLFCRRLSSSRDSLPLRADELKLLVAAASKLRSTRDLSLLQDEFILDILRRVCNSRYILKEPPSRLVKAVSSMEGKFPRSQLLRKCRRLLRRSYAKAGYVHYHPRHRKYVKDINSALMQLVPDEVQEHTMLLDPEKLLLGLENSAALDKLVTRRPRLSALPHLEAVRVCIEHALVWLNAPHMRVFYPLPLTYCELSNVSQEFMHHWDVRVPSTVERYVRSQVFVFSEKSHLGLGDLHYLKPEDYEHPKYLLRCLREIVSSQKLEILRSLQLPYRATDRPGDRAFQKDTICEAHAETCKILMPREPPQYRHLYCTK